ncbi:hypothetical protein FOCC_FOCC009667, partial [Frankliniella occidentalis]
TWPFHFDDTLSIKATIASWGSGGGWKDNAYVVKMDKVCSNFRTHIPNLWHQLGRDAYNDPNVKCPLPLGPAVFKNITADFGFTPIPSFYYGKYRITLLVAKTINSETVACLRVFGETVPKV